MEVCCFDKTGTLTSDHLLLQGVSAVAGHPPEELVPPDAQFPPEVGLVFACCQSLVLVDGNLIGDPLEKAGLTVGRVGWAYRRGGIGRGGVGWGEGWVGRWRRKGGAPRWVAPKGGGWSSKHRGRRSMVCSRPVWAQGWCQMVVASHPMGSQEAVEVHVQGSPGHG